MELDGFTIEPLTPDRFDDFVTVLGRGGQGGCWCMWWIHPTSKVWSAAAKGGSSAANKEAFRAVVAAGPPPGLLAYDGAEPVAWCRIVPRTTLSGIERSRRFKTDLDTEGVWSLSCFVVRSGHRGRGLTGLLARAAVEFARGRGARAVEVYPWAGGTTSPAKAYLGVASTFRRLGFAEVQRNTPDQPMMRLELG
jgi:GNAT superfamily N-acetyltransferase